MESHGPKCASGLSRHYSPECVEGEFSEGYTHDPEYPPLSGRRRGSFCAIYREEEYGLNHRRNPTSGNSATEHPTPPRPLYVFLSLSRSGVRLLCLIGLLLDRLRRFSGLSEGLQLCLEGRGPLLCHLPADPFGSELLTNLPQFAHKWP